MRASSWFWLAAFLPGPRLAFPWCVCVYMSAELCGIHFHKNCSSVVIFSDPVSPQFLPLGACLQMQLPCASVYNWGKHWQRQFFNAMCVCARARVRACKRERERMKSFTNYFNYSRVGLSVTITIYMLWVLRLFLKTFITCLWRSKFCLPYGPGIELDSPAWGQAIYLLNHLDSPVCQCLRIKTTFI